MSVDDSSNVASHVARACAAVAWVCVCLIAVNASAQAVAEPPPAEVPAPVTDPTPAPLGSDAAPSAVPPADAPSLPPAPPLPRLVLVSTQAIGVDPVVSRFVNDALVQAAGEQGYAVVFGEETAAFAQRVTLPYPPAPADLWRLTYAASAQRGVFARVWAEGGAYVTEVLVASVDGAGPFVQRAPSSAADLQSVVRTLLQQTLPAPSAQPLTAPPPSASERPAVQTTPPLALPTPGPEVESTALPTGPRWTVAAQTEAAFGAGGEFFYNHLLGARLDYRLSRDLYLGAYLGYANLRGRQERVHNMVGYLQLENRIAVSPRSPLTIPLRLALGYVPRNGPMLRLASGLLYAVSPRVSLGLDVIAPTFWVIRDRVLFSMDIGAELMFTL